MILARIAFRNVFRNKRRSLFTGMLMAGAFILFSVSLGVTEGSYSRIIEIYTRSHTGHIQIHRKGYLDKPSIYTNFKDHESIAAQISSVPAFASWAPRVYAPALAFLNKKTVGVRIAGIDPQRESETTFIRDKIMKGRFISGTPAKEILIGTRLAHLLKADLEDEIALISQGADGSIANDLFRVAGILKGEENTYCYMHINGAQDFLFLHERVHEIAVTLTHHSQAEYAADILRKKLAGRGLEISPWQDIEKDFYRAMQMDKQGNWITQSIIMFIVAIGVLNTVLMMLLERTREFGVLRSIGTRPYQIFSLILLETGFLSLISIAVGGILSLFFNYVLAVYGIELPIPIELEGLRFESYVSEVTARTILLPAVVTLCVALTVSIFPALRAARIPPVKALRSQ